MRSFPTGGVRVLRGRISTSQSLLSLRPFPFSSIPTAKNPIINLCRPRTPVTFWSPAPFLANLSRSHCFSIPAAAMDGGSSNGLVSFALSPTSTASLKIQRGDITQWFVDGSSDAIVNPANERMLGGGGADGAIHKAAGPELRTACYDVPEVRPGVRCPTGEARITPGFKLPASHIIHTVGPVYDTDSNPEGSLRSAYRNSLRVAKENNIQYIAFTAISCGVYGYPFDEAATIAVSTINEFANDFKEVLSTHVHFVLFSDDIYNVWVNKARELLQN
ncbi:Macro domain [Dillenia turbinata]|uniref:Macro domain n=1 Tax=Dillenia turbinata TaxID=194707 RepID=A0AAN8VG59_9MAGN